MMQLRQQAYFCKADIFRLIILLILTPGFSPLQLVSAQTDGKNNSGEALQLELNKPLERKLAIGESQTYRVALKENQYAKIIVEQPDFDATVKLLNANGSPVTRFNDEIRVKYNETIEIVADQAGDYQIEIQAMSKSGAGNYRIRLEEIRPATARDQSFFQAHTFIWQADALNESGKWSEALPPAERALEIAEKQLGTEDWLLGRILSELGNIQIRAGKYQIAQTMLERALTISEKSLGADHPQTLLCRHNLAANYDAAGEYAKSERAYRQVVADYERTLGADSFRLGNALIAFGGLLNFLGDSEQAEIYLGRALPILEKHFGAEHSTIARLLRQIGTIYLNRRENDRAAEYFQKSLAIYEKTSGPESAGYSSTLLSIGVLHRRRKEFDKALEIYNRVLAIDEKNLGKEHPNIAVILNNTANIHYEKGDIPKALETQRAARALAEKSVGLYHANTLLSLENSARYYAVLGDVPNAITYRRLWDERYEKVLALNLTIGPERQKLAYMRGLITMTARTIALHLDQAPNNQTALEMAALVVLQRKGRVLDAVADNMAALQRRAGAEDLALLERLSESTAALAKLTLAKPAKMPLDEYQKQLAELENRKETIEREINNRGLGFAPVSPTVTLEAMRSQIPPDAALVEFAVYLPYNPKAGTGVVAVGEPHYIAYVIKRDGAIRYQVLGEAKTIDQTIDEWRKALRDPQSKDETTLARRADEKIMQPVRALLGGATRLLISPDGELNLIPFEALADEKDRRLVENFSLTYLSSGRDLLRMRSRLASKSESLLLADPQFGAEQALNVGKAEERNRRRSSVTTARNLSDTYFAPISGTVQEARSIQTLFPNAQVLTGAKASETALKKVNAPRILHIATHGFFLVEQSSEGEKTAAGEAEKNDGPKNPLLRSGLALAGANRRDSGQADDGILTALEASGLNLWGTKLVTLSACDTGLGEVKTSEGVYGLRRAFVLAGAETLLMSLWPISDYVTRELMTNYYKNLKQGTGRSDSLRRAQLEMLKRNNRRHPFYWAAFIQSGEWANLDGVR